MEIVIYILFYHYFITSSFHPYPSLLYSSTILLSYPYPSPLSYPLIYQPLFYHILFTFTLSPFYYHTNISFYTFQDKKKIYILPIIYNYYKYLYQKNTILYYFTYSPSYTILIYTLTPTIYIIYLPFHHHQYIEYLSTQTYTHTHTHRHIHTHTQTDTYTTHTYENSLIFIYIIYKYYLLFYIHP